MSLSHVETMKVIQNFELPDSKVFKSHKPRLLDFIRACIVKQPEKRPSAEKLLIDFNDLFEEGETEKYIVNTLKKQPNIIERVSSKLIKT